LLRPFRAQRRRQDDDDQVSTESSTATERASASVRYGSKQARGGGEAPDDLRSGPGGVLSLDEHSRDSSLPPLNSPSLACALRTMPAYWAGARSESAYDTCHRGFPYSMI